MWQVLRPRQVRRGERSLADLLAPYTAARSSTRVLDVKRSEARNSRVGPVPPCTGSRVAQRPGSEHAKA